MPQRIEFMLTSSNKLGVIEFVYDATGAKLRKIVTQTCLNPAAPCAPTLSTTYDYVNGVEYKNGNLERVAHSEGSISKNVNTGSFELEYVLRDHLGNSRVAFRDSDNDGIVKNEKPSDNLPQTLEGILAERKKIKEESHGKPNKE